MSARSFAAGLLGAFFGHVIFTVVFLIFEERALALGDLLEERGWWE